MGNKGQAIWVAIAMLIFAAAGVGGGMYLQRTALPAPEDVAADKTTGGLQDETVTQVDAAEAVVENLADALTDEAPVSDLPRIDVVRVDPDGGALVAGSGPVGEQVTLRLDGAEVATAEADADGNFVSFFDLETGEKPGLLTLETASADGTIRQASDSIIVAPPAEKTADLGVVPAPVATDPKATDLATLSEEADAETPPLDRPVPSAPGAPPAVDPPLDAPAVAAVPTTAPTITSDDNGAAPEAVIETARTEEDTEVQSTAEAEVDLAAARPAPQAEPAAPRLFRTGPEGVTVLSDPAQPPEVTETLGIDAIAYDETGEVQLTGRAVGDSELRIYLDNRAVRTVRVSEGGSWASPLPDVETGVYTLRIDALSDDGSVASRIETPFERTAPELAAAAREAGVTAITVQPGFTLWAISQGYFGDGLSYVQIFETNRDIIRDPDLIYPGQVITLPEAAISETALAESEAQQ
ncbi:MAG: LysM peptidoglycan-binding domain-containing protein [Pseudomonadota bacterium]